MVRIFAFFLTFPVFAGNFEVRGRVTDSLYEKPIAPLNLAIKTPQGTHYLQTNRRGEYRFVLKSPTEGDLTVTASRPGLYRPTTSRVVNIQRGSYETVNIEMDYEAWVLVETGDVVTMEPTRVPASVQSDTRTLEGYLEKGYTYQPGDAWNVDANGDVTGVVWKTKDNESTKVSFRMRQVCLGDFNEDRYVNGEDMAIWQNNYGKKGKLLPTDGDLNGDNRVDEKDYAMLQPAFGTRYDVQCKVVRSPKIVEWIRPKN